MTPNDKITGLQRLFPESVIETRDPSTGAVTRRVDPDRLRAALQVELGQEHLAAETYAFTWPGKAQARRQAAAAPEGRLHPRPDLSKSPETTGHRLIVGDNLTALKLLRAGSAAEPEAGSEIGDLAGQVRLIYIDPPYNTGNAFIFPDNFRESLRSYTARKPRAAATDPQQAAEDADHHGRFHADWLSFMLPRLEVARDLLREDGCIVISIDENELPNLWKLCEEVFGAENFVECMVYDKKSSAKGVPPAQMIAGVHEYLLVFQRSSAFSFIGRPRSPEGFDNPDNDPRGPWRNTNCKSTVKDPREAFEVEDPATGRRFRDVWAFSPAEMARKAGAGELIFPKSQTGQVRMKEYFNEFRNANIPIKSSLGLYDAQYNTQYLTRLMGAKVFLNPKHIRLMRDLLAFTTQGDDIVLDFFGGSGTTADALLSLNAEDGQRRRFVLVQLDVPVEPTSAAGKAGYASIADLCRDRIDRAGAALDPAKAHPDWDGDTGYRVFDVGPAD